MMERRTSSSHSHPQKPSQAHGQHSSGVTGSTSQQSRTTPSSRPAYRLKEKKSKFSVEFDFINDLPNVPVLPKLMKSPFIDKVSDELVNYNSQSIEVTQGIPLLTDRYTSMPLTIVDTTRYLWPLCTGPKTLDPADLFLLASDAVEEQKSRNAYHVILPSEVDAIRHTISESNASSTASKTLSEATKESISTITSLRSAQVNFLHKPEYSEDKVLAFTQQSRLREEAREEARRTLKQDTENSIQEYYKFSPAERIENSFKAVRAPPVHPTDPTLQPVEISPLIPDLMTLYSEDNFAGRVKTSYSRSAMISAAKKVLERNNATVKNQATNPQSHLPSKSKKSKKFRHRDDDAVDSDVSDDFDTEHDEDNQAEFNEQEDLVNSQFLRLRTTLAEYSRPEDIKPPAQIPQLGSQDKNNAQLAMDDVYNQGLQTLLLRHSDKLVDQSSSSTLRPRIHTSFGFYFKATTEEQRQRPTGDDDLNGDDPLEEDDQPIRDHETVYAWDKELILAPSLPIQPDDNIYIVQNTSAGSMPFTRYGRFDSKVSFKKRISTSHDSCANIIRHRPARLAIVEEDFDETHLASRKRKNSDDIESKNRKKNRLSEDYSEED